MQFLTGLGNLDGEIEAKNPILILYKLTGDHSMDITSYRVVSRRLSEKGIIDIEEATPYSKVIKLTELGKEYVSQIKALSLLDELNPPTEHLYYGTGFTILEYILDNSSFTDENSVRWLRAPNAQEPIANFFANELGLSYDAFTRRVYELRMRKRHLVEEKTKLGKNEQLSNLGVTPEGMAWMERVKERVEGKKPYSDEELEEVISMTQTAIELAEQTGASTLAEQLREKYEITWLLDLNKVQFEEHTFWLERTLDRLRNEYLFENS